MKCVPLLPAKPWHGPTGQNRLEEPRLPVLEKVVRFQVAAHNCILPPGGGRRRARARSHGKMSRKTQTGAMS